MMASLKRRVSVFILLVGPMVAVLPSYSGQGANDEVRLRAQPVLTAGDVQALCGFARVPARTRRIAGARAEDAEELDDDLEWTRQQRKISRREIEE